jgi:hypothetical protein
MSTTSVGRSRRAFMSMATACLAFTAVCSAEAQSADSTRQSSSEGTHSLACAQSGTTLRGWIGGTPADSIASRGAGALREAGSSGIDTTITLNISDRTWQRDSLSAGVALGAAGLSGARQAAWSTCAGASVMLGHVTATLHDIHGLIHLKVDPSVLDSIGATARSTPPAGPPRR